jgi:hypothetical protein
MTKILNKINELLYTVAIASIAIIVIISAIFIYWAFWPDTPIVTSNKDSVRLEKLVYHSGDTITYYIDYCKTRSMPMTVNRSLVDGFVVSYAPVETDPPVGCHTTISSSMKIPEYIPAGIYHIEANISARINPLRTFSEHWRSVDFKIE